LNHETTYHSDKELPVITLPEPEKAIIKFDITEERDLKKTVWYPFVCYADFEASTKVEDGKTIQVPNSYVIFSPDLSQLVDEALTEHSFIKLHFSDDPEVLMRNFIDDLSTLHKSHIMRMTANAKVPRLSREEEKYKEANTCENCKLEFGTRTIEGDKVVKVRRLHHVTNKFVGAWCSRCNFRTTLDTSRPLLSSTTSLAMMDTLPSDMLLSSCMMINHIHTTHKRSYPRAVRRSNSSSMEIISSLIV
jgi:hypothetical protein